MTKLTYWYQTQTSANKNTFRDYITKSAGCSIETFYNYLKYEAPKMVKELLAEKTGIAIQELYKTIKP